jgi:hypothetical protein
VYVCMYMREDVMAERQDKDGEEDDEMRQGGETRTIRRSQPQATTTAQGNLCGMERVDFRKAAWLPGCLSTRNA